jgi:DNA-binding NarL/FixJ family response regulator
MSRPRVLLADDHKETAAQLRHLLEADFDVVALVEDGQSLVTSAFRLSPDAIVTDISMPGLDGIEACAQIRRNDPEARIVLVTVHAEPILVQRGLAAGALGYVLKDAAGDELVAAVHAALGGHRFVSSALSGPGARGEPEES